MTTWIFGYGSLLFRPGFPFHTKERARVRGYVRRFHQGSPDHRGTEAKPGRVVTLVAREGDSCDGVVFAVAEADAARTLADLDVREQGGYGRARVNLETAGGAREAITWIAPPTNPHWLGDASLDAIAAHVRASVGPSGANVDYVLRLDDTLRELDIEDDHVRAIAALLRDDRRDDPRGA